ncbi:MAG: cell division protein FtsZ [Proteobacteria bacterium]|nr:cell division protein FtsZ [Pseudomonadota bacterium]
MAISVSIPEQNDLKPRLCVFGVGGAGGNAVNNMVDSHLAGVEFWVANTDAQALEHSKVSHNRIQLGVGSTQGLGAGSFAEVGQVAAEESWAEINNALDKCNMVFITAGMGGGTGSGAGPVVAKLAKEKGILTVGVVTKPFHFEGKRRMEVAERGLEEMYKYCDTLIIIPNQNLFRVANERTTFADAFRMADEVLLLGVRGISDLITMPGLVNLDFADIRTVMSASGGKAMMGTGEAEGEERALRAAEAAISNPLLDSSSMKGARGVIINITGGTDMTLFEVEAAVERVREEVDPDANIIFGSAFNAELQNKIKVSVVATGIDNASESQRQTSHISMSATRTQEPSLAVEQAAPPIVASARGMDGSDYSVGIEAAEVSKVNAMAQIVDDMDSAPHKHAYTQHDRDVEEDEEETDYSGGFIPPKVQEPKQSELSNFAQYTAMAAEEEEYNEENAPMSAATSAAIAAAGAALSASRSGSANTPQADAASKSGISIFGKVAASFKNSIREPQPETNKAEDSLFDEPAFMRRRSGGDK